MTTSSAKRPLKVGDKVLLPIGRKPFPGVVIEDRGNLGVHGERILRLEVNMGFGAEATECEVSEDQLDALWALHADS